MTDEEQMAAMAKDIAALFGRSVAHGKRIEGLENTLADSRKTGKHFVPPTRDEVAAYCQEKGLSLDMDSFYDHYEACGWRCGKNPMRDWRAAVRKAARTWAIGSKAKLKKHSPLEYDCDHPGCQLKRTSYRDYLRKGFCEEHRPDYLLAENN